MVKRVAVGVSKRVGREGGGGVGAGFTVSKGAGGFSVRAGHRFAGSQDDHFDAPTSIISFQQRK